MNGFEKTLNFAGLTDPSYTEGENCVTWTGRQSFVQAPITIVQITGCSSKHELIDELKGIKGANVTAVISTRRAVETILSAASEAGLTDCTVESEMLFKIAVEKFGPQINRDTDDIYIEPLMIDKKAGTENPAILSLMHWLRAETKQYGRMAIVTGNAGFGKTTLTQNIAQKIVKTSAMRRIPVYINSDHWKKLVGGGRYSLRGIFTEAVSNAFPNSAIGDDVIEHLISRGALVPIFDGLDELCTDAYTETSVSEIIGQMNDLFDMEYDGKAVFTSRSTYWADVTASDRMQLYGFEIRPFDAARREKFVSEWLTRHGGDKNFILQTFSMIDSIVDMKPEARDAVGLRLSQSPYIAKLICLGSSKQSSSKYDLNQFVNGIDPLDSLVVAALNREEDRYPVPPSIQRFVLFTLSLFYGNTFSYDETAEVLELYDVGVDLLDEMLSHHFITNHGARKGFLFEGMSDYLRAKAIASFIYEGDEGFLGVEEYFRQINNMSDASVDIFASISSFHIRNATLEHFFSTDRVQNAFSGDGAQGILILFWASLKRVYNLTREEVRNTMVNTLLGGVREFNKIDFSGNFEHLDFRGMRFNQCSFQSVVFKDCLFDDETIFKFCEILDEFEVLSSPTFAEVQEENCNLRSMQARAAFAGRKTENGRRRIYGEDVRAVVKEMIRQLNLRDNVFVDVSKEGVMSRVKRKNSYMADSVMDELERQGVFQNTRGTRGHKARVAVSGDAYSDVVAFWKDGAEIGAVRTAIKNLDALFGIS